MGGKRGSLFLQEREGVEPPESSTPPTPPPAIRTGEWGSDTGFGHDPRPDRRDYIDDWGLRTNRRGISSRYPGPDHQGSFGGHADPQLGPPPR